jgi:hypothetical protein
MHSLHVVIVNLGNLLYLVRSKQSLCVLEADR